MFEHVQQLAEHWHVCALSKDIAKKPFRVTIYERNLVIWRSSDKVLNALADFCLHQKAPLSSGWIAETGITCPYHGWVFDGHGKCRKTPSDFEFCSKIRAQIPSFHVCDSEGFVWVYLGHNRREKVKPPPCYKFRAGLDNKWKFIYRVSDFNCGLEALIENFMDSAHTAEVHNGLIRNRNERFERRVTVESEQHSVKVRHHPCSEKIGLASSLLFGKESKLEHTDHYLVPNSVVIDYVFHPTCYKFRSIIHCIPISDYETRAFLCVGTKFSWLNVIAPFVLRILSNLILKQDQRILALQTQNRARFHNQKEILPPSDYAHQEVRRRRKQASEKSSKSDTSSTSSRTFELSY